jgi:hypothetical protein
MNRQFPPASNQHAAFFFLRSGLQTHMPNRQNCDRPHREGANCELTLSITPLAPIRTGRETI